MSWLEPGTGTGAFRRLAGVQGRAAFPCRRDDHDARDRGGSLTGYVKVMRTWWPISSVLTQCFMNCWSRLRTRWSLWVRMGASSLQTPKQTGCSAITAKIWSASRWELLPDRFRGRHQGHRMEFFVAPTLRQMGSGLQLWGLRCDETEFPVISV